MSLEGRGGGCQKGRKAGLGHEDSPCPQQPGSAGPCGECDRVWALAAVSLLLGLQVKAQPAPCFPPGKTPRRDKLSFARPRPRTHRSCQVVSGLCPKLVSLCRFPSMARGPRWALVSPKRLSSCFCPPSLPHLLGFFPPP